MSIDGQAVVLGSLISATGSMLVNCNVPYTLEVDGVLWSPIGKRDGADEYVVSSSGEFVILSEDGDRLFFFRNSIEQDFSIDTTRVNFILNDTNVGIRQSVGSYVQTSFVNCDRASVQVKATDKTLEELRGLTPIVSQGEVSEITVSGGYCIIRIGGISTSSYLQVSLGNVLIAFVTPLN